jgi:hypothetical protein
MQKILIGVAVLVIIGLGIWFALAGGMVGQSPGTEASSTTEAATTTNTGSSTGSQSGTTLRSIVSQSGNFTCTVNAVQSSGQTTGTIYGASGKVRLDFTAPSQNGSLVTHIIRSGGYSYIWVDGQSTGIKTAVKADDSITPASGGNVSDDSKVSSE